MTATGRVPVGSAHPMNGWFQRNVVVQAGHGEGRVGVHPLRTGRDDYEIS